MRLIEAADDPFADWDDAQMLNFRLAVAAAPWHKVRYRLKTFKEGMFGNEVLDWIQSCELSGADTKSKAIAMGDAMLRRRLFFQLNRRGTVDAFRPTSGQLYVLSDPYPSAKAESTDPDILATSAFAYPINTNATSRCEPSHGKEDNSIVSSHQQKGEWALDKPSFSILLSPQGVKDNELESIAEVSAQMNVTQDRLQEFALALQAAPWHRVWHRYTAYSNGMTGEELAAWILTTPTFAASTRSEAHLIAEAMMRHGLFFRLNRLKEECGFCPTAAHLYVRENPWGEAVIVSIEETLTLSIVSFEEVEKRRGTGSFTPVPRSLYGIRFDTIDALQAAIVLPSVHGTISAHCEWVDEWSVLFRDSDADGWRYGVASGACVDIELHSKHRFRRRVWQRAARVRPVLTTGPSARPISLDSDHLVSPILSPSSVGCVQLMADSPDLRRRGLERTAGRQIEIFVNYAELDMCYQKLYVCVVDDGPKSLQTPAATPLTNGATTFKYEWCFPLTCEHLSLQRPVTLEFFTMDESIARIHRVVARAELFLVENATYDKATLKVFRVEEENDDNSKSHVTDLGFVESDTTESLSRPFLYDDDGKYNEDNIGSGVRQSSLGYVDIFWKITGTLEADGDKGNSSLEKGIEGSLTQIPSMSSGQFVYLRVSIIRGDDLPLEPSPSCRQWSPFGQCLFPRKTSGTSQECMFDVAYSSGLCTLALHSPTYIIQKSTNFNGEFDWRFTVMTNAQEPVVITLSTRRRQGKRWNPVGAVRLLYAEENSEAIPGSGHLRRQHLGQGFVTLIYQWIPLCQFV